MMSDGFHENDEEKTLVENVDENVSTDIIQDIKSGIFNLFVNMYTHVSLRVGSKESMKYCILYLQEIIDHFQKTIESEDNNKQQTE